MSEQQLVILCVFLSRCFVQVYFQSMLHILALLIDSCKMQKMIAASYSYNKVLPQEWEAAQNGTKCSNKRFLWSNQASSPWPRTRMRIQVNASIREHIKTWDYSNSCIQLALLVNRRTGGYFCKALLVSDRIRVCFGPEISIVTQSPSQKLPGRLEVTTGSVDMWDFVW